MDKEYYTNQRCSKCGRIVELKAINFLLNLEKETICEECAGKTIALEDLEKDGFLTQAMFC